jgi:hypothetical protein
MHGGLAWISPWKANVGNANVILTLNVQYGLVWSVYITYI